MSRILCCTRECRAGGRGCYRALLLAVLLTHMTALARSWNMNMCGMTLLFIINPCPIVQNRDNAFPRLRRSSLEHLHQLLCLITLRAGNNSRSCAGGNCICTLAWLKTQIKPTEIARGLFLLLGRYLKTYTNCLFSGSLLSLKFHHPFLPPLHTSSVSFWKGGDTHTVSRCRWARDVSRLSQSLLIHLPHTRLFYLSAPHYFVSHFIAWHSAAVG